MSEVFDCCSIFYLALNRESSLQRKRWQDRQCNSIRSSSAKKPQGTWSWGPF